MLRKTRILCLSVVIAVTFFSGCGSNHSDTTSDGNTPDTFPDTFRTVEEVLAEIARAKFLDYREGYHDRRIEGLKELRVFFEPQSVVPGYRLQLIESRFYLAYPVIFRYALNDIGPYFQWNRQLLLSDEEYYKVYDVTHSYGAINCSWVQYGYKFQARMPDSHTHEELLEFCAAKPVISWELDGDAVSLTIWGMENIGIVDENENEIVADRRIVPRHPDRSELYLGNGIEADRIGYRWQIDKNLLWYQYALKPGTYTFSFNGVIDQVEEKLPGMWVKHFVDGELASYMDYSEELESRGVRGFTITVTSDPADTVISA